MGGTLRACFAVEGGRADCQRHPGHLAPPSGRRRASGASVGPVEAPSLAAGQCGAAGGGGGGGGVCRAAGRACRRATAACAAVTPGAHRLPAGVVATAGTVAPPFTTPRT